MNKNPVATAWGEVIFVRRTSGSDKLSRPELAAKLGVTRQMVRLWEEGIHTPSPTMQGKLIRVLDIDADTVAALIRKAVA